MNTVWESNAQLMYCFGSAKTHLCIQSISVNTTIRRRDIFVSESMQSLSLLFSICYVLTVLIYFNYLFHELETILGVL